MLALKKVPSIDFVKHSRWAFGFSGIFLLVILASMLFVGLPKGVDFKGGVLLEIRTPTPLPLEDVRQALSQELSGPVSVQTAGTGSDYILRLDAGDLEETENSSVQLLLKKALKTSVEVRRLESIGPTVSQELMTRGIYAVFYALCAMMLYIWYRFEFQAGLAALIALLHDCFGVLALYALGRFEFTEASIVAVLITASYSINDTVVIFDRVRENQRVLKGKKFFEILNQSINETLSRTLLTSVTTLSALMVLYFFGGPVISVFSLPILIGLTVGTYSSIFIAGPLLLFFHRVKFFSGLGDKKTQ